MTYLYMYLYIFVISKGIECIKVEPRDESNGWFNSDISFSNLKFTREQWSRIHHIQQCWITHGN